MKQVERMAGAIVDGRTGATVTGACTGHNAAKTTRTPKGTSGRPAGSTATDAPNVGHRARPDWIDDVLEGSFPASDPPSWMPGVTRPAPPARRLARRETPLTFLVSYVPDEREMYGEALKIAGFDVRTFADPMAALDAAVAAQPGVIVTRILQPGFDVDGLELTRRIRRHPRTHGAAVL